MDGRRVQLKLVPDVVGALAGPAERCILEISKDFIKVSCDDLDPIFETHTIVGIEFPDTITEIDECLLEENETIEYVKIGKKVTKIGASAFLNCTKLETVTLPYYSTLTEIGAHAFDGCVSLETEITFPKTLQTIGDKAFNGCTSLTTISFGVDSLRMFLKIGVGCFASCTKLQTVNGVDQILLHLDSHAFYHCDNLRVDRSWKFEIVQTRKLSDNGAFKYVPCPFPLTIAFHDKTYQVDDWHATINDGKDAFFETAVAQHPDLKYADPSALFEKCSKVLENFNNGRWLKQGFLVTLKKRKAQEVYLSFIDLGAQ